MKAFDLIIGLAGLLFTSLLVIPLLPERKKSTGGLVLVILITLLTSVPIIQIMFEARTIQYIFAAGAPFGNIPIRIDPLSAWFMLIINLTCLNGVLYGKGYMKPYEAQKNNTTLHWILFVTLHISMLGACIIQHGLAFLIAWEMMSLSALLLLMFEHTKPETLKAGVNYLMQMHIGIILLTVGFIWVYLAEGSFDFIVVGTFFGQHPPGWLFLVFFAGFGIKAGFIPLHTWLPHAHPAAPSHISGIMSGVITKLGIYGILRTITYLQSGFLQTGEAVLALSMLTAFYGILNAAVHRDFKRMLAFCTIENIGIAGMGIGIGLIGRGTGNPVLFFMGFAAALLHVFNHSLYKSLLFFTAGNIYQQTHTRDMEQLGGLIKKMPVSALSFLSGALAISALPPFNGFVSEFLIYSGLVNGIKAGNVQLNLLMIFGIAALAIVGGLSLLTFTKSFGTIFLGKPRMPLMHPQKEVETIMQIPLFIILALMVLVGIFPNAALLAVSTVINVFDNAYQPGNTLNALLPVLKMTGRVSMLLLALVALVYYLRVTISKKKLLAFSPTWGCGYTAPNARMQYTGKSFTKSLAKLFSFLTSEKKKYQEIDNTAVFPATRSYRSHYIEFFETKVIDRLNNRLIGFMNYFTFIHNGQTQRYVLYGLLFIIAFIAATFLNVL